MRDYQSLTHTKWDCIWEAGELRDGEICPTKQSIFVLQLGKCSWLQPSIRYSQVGVKLAIK
jgi:hypothetical protein